MKPRQRWFQHRAAALRHSASRGATLVEYALVVSLLVVGLLAVLDRLTEAAEGEVDNQADCVSDRPPPTDDAECQFAPTPPHVTAPDPSVVPPTTAPPVAAPDIYTISAGPADDDTDAGWRLILPVMVMVEIQEPPAPAEGASDISVRARVMMEDPSDPGEDLPEAFTECTTDADGQCDLIFDVPFSDVERATMLVIDVGSNPPPEDLPPLYSFDRS